MMFLWLPWGLTTTQNIISLKALDRIWIGSGLTQSHIERELRQLHSLQWNVFFFTAMAARGASQKFPEVAANTCSAIEMQQNKPFATHF